MRPDLDHALRGAVNQLADEGRPVNLGDRAIRQGRRIIRRRRAVTATAALAVIAALAVPFAVLSQHQRTIMPGGARSPEPPAPTSAAASMPPPASPSAVYPESMRAARPLPLDDGPLRIGMEWILAGAPAKDGSWVFNRDNGAYQLIKYPNAVPAPRGDLVAITQRGQLGLLSLGSGSVNWVTGPMALGRVDWLDDGTRLLYAGKGDADGRLRLTVVNAVRGTASRLGADIECYENCAPSWLPGGKEIAVTQPWPRVGVQLYSAADGRPTRSLALPGAIPGIHSWSPDQRFVVTQSPTGASVFDLVSDRELINLHVQAAGVYWLGGAQLLSIEGDVISTYDLKGRPIDAYSVPEEFLPGEVYYTVLARP